MVAGTYGEGHSLGSACIKLDDALGQALTEHGLGINTDRVIMGLTRMLRQATVFALSLLLALMVVGESPVRARPMADWTLALYFDSDNGLDFWAQRDVDEMMSVGSTEAVNIVLFWDRYDGPAHAYRVVRNGLIELRDFSLTGTEPNMGDPATLNAFVSYAFRRYPARRCALLCFDHGDDFRGCMYDEHIPYEGFDLLTHQEIVRALTGFHIDVLIYAACVLSTIEVAYEYQASALDVTYYVASEGYDTMDSFPYQTTLAKLTARPSMTPFELARTLVDDHIDYYSSDGKPYSQSVTFSVVQIDRVAKVVVDLKAMTQAIATSMTGYEQIVSDARGHANLPWSENGWERLIDLTTFVKTIHDESLNPKLVSGIDPAMVASVVSSSETLLSSLSNAIVYHRSLDAMEKKGCFGLAIYFPTSQASYERDRQLYELMLFAEQGWPDFLTAYWEAQGH